MAIEFTCSQCQCELRVQDQDAGKKARCPRCGMIHEVPGGPDAPSGEAETTYHPSGAMRDDRVLWSLQTPDGQVFGPVPRSELDEWAGEGRVSGQCLVQSSGSTNWESALTLYPDLAGVDSRLPRQAGEDSSHAGGSTGSGHSQGTAAAAGAYARRAAPYHSHSRRPNNGVGIFVLGIIGLVFVAFPIIAVIALIMGNNERKAIARHEVSAQSRWLVDCGYVFGVLGTVIGGLMYFGCCFLAPFAR